MMHKELFGTPINRYKVEFDALDKKGRKICVEELACSGFVASLQAEKWLIKEHPELADKNIKYTVREISGKAVRGDGY